MSHRGDPPATTTSGPRPRRPASHHRSRTTGSSDAFRADIQGLRGVAVLLVVVYHAGLPLVPGGFVGVDVFFVISGFLITTLLLSEVERSGTVSLWRFYARRAKRLLPAAATVLVATAGLVWWLVPRVRWDEIGGDIAASALYVVNWRLAERSVDYLAEESAPSPVQHYWSLAVEEQFYLMWPVLILLTVLFARAAARSARPLLVTVLVAVTLLSFGWALAQTAAEPERAFFVTPGRIWELAAGALIALGAARCARIPRRWGVALGWAGLAAIAAAAAGFSATTPWPGHAALLPTAGAAAVIVGGFGSGPAGAAALLRTRLLRTTGDLSYSLYLWHWPLLVVAAAHWGDLSTGQALVVAAASAVPAWLTYRLVENPVRFSGRLAASPQLAVSLGANVTAAGAAAGLVLLLAVGATATAPGGARTTAAPGAAVLDADPRGDPDGATPTQVTELTPDPQWATEDIPSVYDDGCHQDQRSPQVLSCTYGAPDALTTVAVAGDSKIAQWIPALRILAQQNDWRLVTYTKSACAFTSATIRHRNGRPYDSCTAWHEALLDRLTTTELPDYLLTSQASSEAYDADGGTDPEAMVAGLITTWDRLVDAGIDVIVVADNPHPGMNVYECVSAHPDQLAACAYPRDRRAHTGAYATQVTAVERQGRVAMIDLFDAICPVDPCSPVIGEVLVYRQGSHLTATYVETMAPRLAAALDRVGLPARTRSRDGI